MITRSKVAKCLPILLIFSLITNCFSRSQKYINCKGCRMKCQNYGIEANANPYINKIELCCMGSCLVEINSIEKLQFQLPKDVTSLDYNCRATYWSKI